MSKFIEFKIQKKIYNLISKNPGLHLSKIAEMLNIRISLAEYHLAYLEKNQEIVSLMDHYYKRYYVKYKLGMKEKRILALLRQEMPLRIVLFLLEHPYSKHKEILKNFDITKSTISYHLKKLKETGIVVEHLSGKKQGFAIVDETEIIGFIKRFKPYSRMESLKDTWVYFRWD